MIHRQHAPASPVTVALTLDSEVAKDLLLALNQVIRPGLGGRDEGGNLYPSVKWEQKPSPKAQPQPKPQPKP